MRILLVGAGSIGKRHLGDLLECGVRDFVVTDTREDRRKEVQEHADRIFQRLLNEGRKKEGPLHLLTSPSLEDAFQRGEPFDGMVVATPPVVHTNAIQAALEARIPVFCEKPLANDNSPWDELVELVVKIEAAGLLSMVAYNYRFNAQLKSVRQMLSEGAVGRILSVRGTFSENLREWHPWEGLNFYMSSKKQGGGALLDESHLLDLCRWVFGEISEVVGYNGTFSSLKEEPSFDADDLVEILVRFESGAVGSLHMDLYGKYHQKRLEVIGEEGTLFWNFDNTDIESNGIQLWRSNRVSLSPESTRRLPERVIPSDGRVRNQMYLEEIRYFLESKRCGRHLREDVPDLKDGLRTLAVVRAARRAAASKKAETVEWQIPLPSLR